MRQICHAIGLAESLLIRFPNERAVKFLFPVGEQRLMFRKPIEDAALELSRFGARGAGVQSIRYEP